jgi:RNA polymerase sigma-70 factor (ECF subfamily)
VDALTRHRSRKARDAVAVLAAAASRLAIHVTQSARVRRQTHISTWLPEPVDTEADLAHSMARAEALDRRCKWRRDSRTLNARPAILQRRAAVERYACQYREASS